MTEKLQRLRLKALTHSFKECENEENDEQVIYKVTGYKYAIPRYTYYRSVDSANILQNGVPLVPSGSVISCVTVSAPSGWLLCDGSSYSISDYYELYEAIGTIFGGSEGTFCVPDLRGRTIVGTGIGPNLTSRSLGGMNGEETHTLTISEIPSHNHGGSTVTAGSHTHTHNANGPSPNYGTGLVVANGYNTTTSTDTSAGGPEINLSTSVALSINSNGAHTHTINAQGGGLAHNIMQPYTVLTYIIKC